MTDTDRGMDPRYDPRFQRGYDASREAEAPSPAPAPPAAGPADPPRPMIEPDSTDSTDANQRAEADAASEPDPRAEPVRGPEPRSRPAQDPVPSPRGARPVPAGRARSWLIAGWAVTGGAMLLGVSLSWSVNSDFSYYGGVLDPSAESLRIIGWALAPALLVAGAIGAVVVTGVAANLGDDARTAAEEGRLGFRRPPAWWALPAIAVASIVLIALAVALAAEGSRVGSTLQFGPGGNVADDQQALLDTIALGQLAQTLIGPMASAAVAALVAVVVIEVGRAVRVGRFRDGPSAR